MPGIMGGLVFWVVLILVAGWHTALVVWAWLMFLALLCLGGMVFCVAVFRHKARQA